MNENVNFIGTQEEWDALVEKNKLRLKAMKKQTAVDFFYWELIQRIDFTPMGGWDVINNILEQAKAMEKEQIMEAVDVGFDDGSNFIEDIKFANSEQYYNETYGN